MAQDGSPALKLEKYKDIMFACTRCGFCRIWDWKGTLWVCPTYPYTEAFDTQYARGRLAMAQSFFRGEAEIDATFLEHLYECSLCTSCGLHCPIDIPLIDIWHAFRTDLAEAGHILPEQQGVVDNIRTYHNVFGEVKRRAGQHAQEPRKVKVLYFPGCQTTRKARQVSKATGELLGKLGIDYAVIGEDVCCGYPLYEIGQMGVMAEDAAHTRAAIQVYQPDVILTTCVGCYRSLKVIYPQELGVELGAKVMHAHEFFASVLPDKLATLSRTVTYHDPCILGRQMGIFEEPRDLIKAIPGIELVEMYSNRKNALCCGGGGGVLSAFTDIAGQVAVERIQQAAAAGVTQLVTSCPTCVVNLKRSVSKAGLEIQVSDIVELLNEAVRVD
jgi:Fe-S oxidoreductase